MLINQLL